VRDSRTVPLAEAMRSATRIAGSGLASIERRGSGDAAVQPWALPYRGRDLQGNEARDAVEGWRERGLCEPGHADALLRVIDNPEWFDLSERTLVLLGAGSEAGPLQWLTRWRARIVAVDLPRRDTWQRIGAVAAARPDTGRMFMATPTDAFVVPAATACEAMRRWDERDLLARAAGAPLRALTGGRWLKPHVTELIGDHGVVDALVVEQGPNYALAKRLQQWRATVAQVDGERVSFNVAPSTSTQSVVSNPALKAGFGGAHHFGIEVFEPATTNALMAALWVHDLRAGPGAGAPPAHPLDALTRQAHHGGLWRVGYLPRSALPLAALAGMAGRAWR